MSTRPSPLLLPLTGFEALGRQVPGVELLVPEVERFENGEIEVRLPATVDERSCHLLGTVAPPGDQLVELLLAADTLRRDGARSLDAVLPYLAYARQDSPTPRVSVAAEWLGRVLAASGFEGVVTIDIHSDAAGELIGLPITSLSPAALLAQELEDTVTADTIVVAPDRGAQARARRAAEALGLAHPVAWLDKTREAGGVTHVGVVGELGSHAIVVDDILDTGGTLVSCCRMLRSLDVEQITVAVTHGLFTGSRWHELADLGVTAIHTTDSVPDAHARALGGPGRTRAPGADLVRIHSVVPLLAEAIGRAAEAPADSGP
jgi:ribose-phosphate pyrophosphokinase